jgi:hypothetical protein
MISMLHLRDGYRVESAAVTVRLLEPGMEPGQARASQVTRHVADNGNDNLVIAALDRDHRRGPTPPRANSAGVNTL